MRRAVYPRCVTHQRGFTQTAGTSSTSTRHSPSLDRPRSPEQGILRRNSDCGTATPTGSSKDLRRSSDFGQAAMMAAGGPAGEKACRSQFATKLRRNSDFGNRTPRRVPEPEAQSKLARILDVSPIGE